MMDDTFEQLRAKLTPFGQTHLLDHWDRLTAVEQDGLADKILAIDFGRLAEGLPKVGLG